MDLVVISSYPEKSLVHGVKTVGVGNYTKHTLTALKNANPNCKITVYAEKLKDEISSYDEDEIHIERVWTRNSILSIISLFYKVAGIKSDAIMIPFEVAMFGNILANLVFLKMLFYLKMRGKKVVLVVHQVPSAEGINSFNKSWLLTRSFSVFNGLFYRYLISVVTSVVVFEKALKERLFNSKKVSVIPHGVFQENLYSQQEAKKQLELDQNTSYVLYFGYLSPYKGVDLLIKYWDVSSPYKLIIAGGGNPNYAKDEEYQAYVSQICESANKKGITVTGFVPQDQMPLYFSACELFIFPYKVFMSSSGPMTQAFTYGKALLLSINLRAYFQSDDMKNGLNSAKLSVDDISFDVEKNLKEKVIWAFEHKDQLQRFSGFMKLARSWDVVGKMYNELLTKGI